MCTHKQRWKWKGMLGGYQTHGRWPNCTGTFDHERVNGHARIVTLLYGLSKTCVYIKKKTPHVSYLHTPKQWKNENFSNFLYVEVLTKQDEHLGPCVYEKTTATLHVTRWDHAYTLKTRNHAFQYSQIPYIANGFVYAKIGYSGQIWFDKANIPCKSFSTKMFVISSFKVYLRSWVT